jgi:MFS transporter, MHS family, proline/betaine transporter
MITLLPRRAVIGIAAPIGILIARLIQGFVLGSEYGSATALMIEHSPNGEARAASWQRGSQNIAGLSASGIAWLRQPIRVSSCTRAIAHSECLV